MFSTLTKRRMECPNYLCIRQHDVLQQGLTLWLPIFHPHVVDLVPSDLAVLLIGHRRAPGHFNSRGVDSLHLDFARRTTRNWNNIIGQKRITATCPTHAFHFFKKGQTHYVVFEEYKSFSKWKCSTNLLYLSVKRSKNMTDAKNGRKRSIREIEKHVKMYKSQGRCFEIQSIIVQRDILIIEIIIL